MLPLLLAPAFAQTDPIDPAEAQALLGQLAGTWTGRAFGMEITLEIAGDQLTESVPGRKVGPQRIEVVSPCTLLRHGEMGGMTMPFAFHQGKLYAFYNAYAVKKGDDVWACHANTVVQLTPDGTCTDWMWGMAQDESGAMRTTWTPRPGKCRMDGTTFVLEVPPTLDLLTGKTVSEVRFEDRGGVWSVDPLEGAPAPTPPAETGKKSKKRKE